MLQHTFSIFVEHAVPLRLFWRIFWTVFGIVTIIINIHLHKSSIFFHSHVDKNY